MTAFCATMGCVGYVVIAMALLPTAYTYGNKNLYHVGNTLKSKASTYQRLNDLERNPMLLELLSRIHDFDLHKGFAKLMSNRSHMSNLSTPEVTKVAANRPIKSRFSRACGLQLLLLADDLLKMKTWALKMIDSWGKLPSGLARVHIRSYGEFEECNNIEVPMPKLDQGRMKGLFCMSDLTLYADPQYTLEISIMQGMCLPDACNSHDILFLINSMLNMTNTYRYFMRTQVTCQHDEQLQPGGIAVLAFVGLIVLLVVMATTVHILLTTPPSKPKGEEKKHLERGHVPSDVTSVNTSCSVTPSDDYQPLLPPSRFRSFFEKPAAKFLLCFSLKTNARKLFDPSGESEGMACLNGMRFLTIVWIICGHVTLFLGEASENTVEYLQSIAPYSIYQVLLNATFSCDSFFTISGLLVSYNLLKALDQYNGRIKWYLFYLRRYLRLTPTLMIALLLYTTTFSAWHNGPVWPHSGVNDRDCQQAWWHNLLYISNFYGSECMKWTWYLSVDTQFYVISPIFIYAFYRNALVGFVLTGVCFSASSIYTGWLCYVSHYAPSTLSVVSGNLTVYGDPWQDYYAVPWCRVTPYLVGIMAGYLLYRCRCTLHIHWVWKLVGWLVIATASATLMFGLTAATILHPHIQPVSLTASVAYVALSRSVWSVCVSWVIVLCVTGNAGPVNKLLSLSVIKPCGRATYCAYLIHEAILLWYMHVQPSPFYVSDANLFVMSTGLIVITTVAALVFSLLFESPFLAMLKLIA